MIILREVTSKTNI